METTSLVRIPEVGKKGWESETSAQLSSHQMLLWELRDHTVNSFTGRVPSQKRGAVRLPGGLSSGLLSHSTAYSPKPHKRLDMVQAVTTQCVPATTSWLWTYIFFLKVKWGWESLHCLHHRIVVMRCFMQKLFERDIIPWKLQVALLPAKACWDLKSYQSSTQGPLGSSREVPLSPIGFWGSDWLTTSYGSWLSACLYIYVSIDIYSWYLGAHLQRRLLYFGCQNWSLGVVSSLLG